MKKYIAPEMEISKFAAEDIMTGSSTPVEPPVTTGITPASDLHYKSFGEDATYGTF